MGEENTGRKIAFLFGAGAEGEGNYNMPTGMEYLIKSTLPQQEGNKKEGYIIALDSFFGAKKKGRKKTLFFDETYGYTGATLSEESILAEILFQLVCDKIENDEVENVEDFFQQYYPSMAVCLNKIQRTALKKLTEKADYEIKWPERLTGDRKKRLKEFGEILFLILKKEIRIYEDIKDEVYRELLLKKGVGLDKEVSFNVFSPRVSGKLDAYFHTIINPKKYGPTNFGKIFNYYWKCYFTILEGVLRSLEDDKPWLKERFLKEGLDYKNILARLPDITKELYNAKISKQENSYYELIRKKLQGQSNKAPDYTCAGVITTNYFHFAERVMGLKEEDVAYINGQLKYFEFPETLEVEDACADEAAKKFGKEKLFFPFIFGQSFVKPIVNDVQIEAFDRMRRILKGAEYLVVLGYGMNEDDNHLNAYLHSYLMRKENGKRGTIIVVGSGDEEEERRKILRKLRCEDEEVKEHLVCCKVDYENKEEGINKIFANIDESV